MSKRKEPGQQGAGTVQAAERRDWDRRANESNPAWHAFVHYRDQGLTRSNAKAWREHVQSCKGKEPGKDEQAPGVWTAYSVTHEWVKRAAAWDEELDRIEQLEMIERRRDMARYQLRIGRLMQTKGAVYIQNNDPKNDGEAVRLVEIGAKLERAAAGEGGIEGGDQTVKVIVEYVDELHGDDTPPATD